MSEQIDSLKRNFLLKEQTKLCLPRATAVWLIDNTALTFTQIAKFCNLHLMQVQAIADGEVAQSVMGYNPIYTGQITREEIKLCEQDPNRMPQLAQCYVYKPPKAHYTALVKRRDKPDAIYWILKNHPEITDKQIISLIKTTQNTISAIRESRHRNMNSITPSNPVLLGLCSQQQLDEAVTRATVKKNT